MSFLDALLSLIIGYVWGSVPFGYLAGRLNRIDIREHGSGNIGFTNVQRVLGWGWALPVLLLDLLKGIGPVLLAKRLGLVPQSSGLGAVLGHIFPVWLKFNGGKGVATIMGVSAILLPRSFFPALLVFLLLLLISGFVSLASISFAISLPVFTGIFYSGSNWQVLTFTLLSGLIIIIRHIPNIRRLAVSQEPKFGIWLKLFRDRK